MNFRFLRILGGVGLGALLTPGKAFAVPTNTSGTVAAYVLF